LVALGTLAKRDHIVKPSDGNLRHFDHSAVIRRVEQQQSSGPSAAVGGPASSSVIRPASGSSA